MKVIIHTDGGSRGNPGPAATGVVIKDTQGQLLTAYGEYLGEQTNNYAEYSAVISSLKKAASLGATEIELFADSKLAVEQLNRNWKVKEPTIQKLFVQAYNALEAFDTYTLKHVRREKNTEADAEVIKVLDAQTE